MLLNERFEQRVPVRVKRFLLTQDFTERPVLGRHPAIEGGEKLIARDEVVLQGQDTEQQIAVGTKGGH